MTAVRVDGVGVAQEIHAAVKRVAAGLAQPPCLAVILVGEDPASEVYVRSKIRATEAAGMVSVHHRLEATTSQEKLETLIRSLSADPSVDGILLQLPLPGGLDADRAIGCIAPEKDVDGLTEISAGRLSLGRPGLRPCTPSGCVILAKTVLGDDLSGRHVVIVGRSILVGKPAGMLFLAENCTVTLAHSRTRDIAGICRAADILVLAAGRAGMVSGDWIRPGAMVIDVGINRVPSPERGAGKTRLVGDADYESCARVAGQITPVPGGVGPMTIACLLRNTVIAACERRGLPVPAGL